MAAITRWWSSNGSGSVTSIVATLTYNDTAPVANPATYSRPAGYPLNITDCRRFGDLLE